MTDQMQITLSHEAHQVLLTNWLRFADSKHPLASEIADAIRNAEPVQVGALEQLHAEVAALKAAEKQGARAAAKLKRLADKALETLGAEFREDYERAKRKLRIYMSRTDELRSVMQSAGLPVEKETTDYVIRNAQMAIASLIDEVDALKAERWEPVQNDQAIVDTYNPYRGAQQQGYKMCIFDDNRAMTEQVNLPDNIRLCRRVTQEPTS